MQFSSKSSLPSTASSEASRDVPPRPSKFFVRLVMTAAVSSFLYGYSITVTNTATSVISAELWGCSAEEIQEYRRDDDTFWNRCELVGGLTHDLAVCTHDHPCTNPQGDACVAPAPTNCSRAVWFNAFLGSAVYWGAAVGAVTARTFASKGKRLTLLLGTLIHTVGTISSVVSLAFPELFWARMFTGVGTGLFSVAIPAYMSEVTPARVRGKYGIINQTLIGTGIFTSVVIGIPFHSPTYDKFLVHPSTRTILEFSTSLRTFDRVWWRVMLALPLILMATNFYLLGFVYKFEPPMTLVEHGKLDEARHVLSKLLDTEKECDVELERLVKSTAEGERVRAMGVTLGRAIRSDEYRTVIVVGCMLAAFQQISGIGPFTTTSNGLYLKAGLTTFAASCLSSLVAGLKVLMNYPTSLLIERAGRKSILVCGISGQLVGVLPTAVAYWVAPEATWTMWVTIVGSIVFSLSFAIGFGPILWVYLFEIFQPEIKSSAASLATCFNWTCGAVFVLVPSLIKSNAAIYTLITTTNLIILPFVIVFMKETKGRPLGDSPYSRKKNI